VRAVVETTTRILNGLAGSDDTDAATSATLEEMASTLSSEAERAGYSVEFVQRQGDDAPLSKPEYVSLLEQLFQRAAIECPGLAQGPPQ
jgi:hypothetical protein